MFVGRMLYLLGLAFTGFSGFVIILSIFSGGTMLIYSLFGLINGLIAIGVGDLVIDLNHKKRMKQDSE